MALLGVMPTAEADKLPRAREYPPHEQRARMDLLRQQGDDPFALTDHERAAGHVRPRWHSYQHKACGTVNSLRTDDAADTLAREPDRPSYRLKGLRCECDGKMHPIFGNVAGLEPEYLWVDTAGAVTTVLVGA